MSEERKWTKEPWPEERMARGGVSILQLGCLSADDYDRARECVNFLARFPGVDLSMARVAIRCTKCGGNGRIQIDGVDSPESVVKCVRCHNGYIIKEPQP